MNKSLAILGGGGHATMLYQVFPELKNFQRRCYVDPLESKSSLFSELKRYQSLEEALDSRIDSFVNGLGTANSLEQRFSESIRAESKGILPVDLVSNVATLYTDFAENSGLQILAQAVIQPGVKLGKHVVINTSAVIEHDAELGDGVFVSPSATILGGAIVERFALIGAGAIILPTVRVGKGAVVGAGSVVTADVGTGETVVGAPARPLAR